MLAHVMSEPDNSSMKHVVYICCRIVAIYWNIFGQNRSFYSR